MKQHEANGGGVRREEYKKPAPTPIEFPINDTMKPPGKHKGTLEEALATHDEYAWDNS